MGKESVVGIQWMVDGKGLGKLKHQIPSTKFQINPKFQIPITQTKSAFGFSSAFGSSPRKGIW